MQNGMSQKLQYDNKIIPDDNSGTVTSTVAPFSRNAGPWKTASAVVSSGRLLIESFGGKDVSRPLICTL